MRYPKDEPYGLVPFQLIDVPLHLREHAADVLARRVELALPPDQGGIAGLWARLREREEYGDDDPASALKRAAKFPSERVYWIPRPAWEKVMGS